MGKYLQNDNGITQLSQNVSIWEGREGEYTNHTAYWN